MENVLERYLETGNSETTTVSGSRGSFLGSAPSILAVRTMIEKVRDSDAPVFILGESGTGKELAARTIHETGRRRAGQFVAVNCGAIPENLLESELFGHARGAFTGAMRDKSGLVEEAAGGTFFLDEIGDLPLALQVKLLRVLEEKKIRRVGETRVRPVDVRFISATNKDIEREVARGNFREDLYYRLKIIPIELPPLRERKEDLLLLLGHFMDEYSRSMRRPRPHFSPLALEMLLSYPWPGNVRELQNEVQRCLIIAGDSPIVREDFLSPKINPGGETYSPASHRLAEARAEFEKRFLREALVRCNFHRSRTAAEIGLTRQGLFKLLKKHNIQPGRPASQSDR
jgi:DNA-binding NtrC family response regulator